MLGALKNTLDPTTSDRDNINPLHPLSYVEQITTSRDRISADQSYALLLESMKKDVISMSSRIDNLGLQLRLMSTEEQTH